MNYEVVLKCIQMNYEVVLLCIHVNYELVLLCIHVNYELVLLHFLCIHTRMYAPIHKPLHSVASCPATENKMARTSNVADKHSPPYNKSWSNTVRRTVIHVQCSAHFRSILD